MKEIRLVWSRISFIPRNSVSVKAEDEKIFNGEWTLFSIG